MRSKWVEDNTMKCILAALMPANRLACEVSLRYGMRIGDVLNLKVEQVMKGDFTYVEQKTGKRRRCHMSPDFVGELLRQSGRVYVFENRIDWRKHRTRQAVYKDIRRVGQAFRLSGVSPHSCRKSYAVSAYKRYGYDLRRVQRLLNHSDEAVTILYAMADLMSKRVEKHFTKFSQKYHTDNT